MMTPAEHSVVVIGVGMVGASVGLALSKAGLRVHLRDHVHGHVLLAEGIGAGTAKAANPTEVSLVVVAVPPDHCAVVISQAVKEFQQATVTDVASVKGSLLPQLEPLLTAAELARYVGSHPMAGSHRSGPMAGDAEMFVDRTWVLTPRPDNDSVRVAQVQRLAQLCGAVTVSMDPVEHDQAVAAISHLPHLASVLVANQLTDIPPHHLALAGQGLRDVTRIAGSDPSLWVQILTANRDAVRPQLESLRHTLTQVLAALDDRTALADTLRHGVAGTQRIPGKHGRLSHEWVDVVVEIPDAPGALARIFAIVETAGVNVEDISIEHDQVREVGFLSLSVEPARVEDLRSALESSGHQCRTA